MIMRSIVVGVVEPMSPQVTECGRRLRTFRDTRGEGCPDPGAYIEIFDMLARKLNLNYTVRPLTTGYRFGRAVGVVNGTEVYDGYQGYLQRGEVDLVLGPFNNIGKEYHVSTYLRPINYVQSSFMASAVQQPSLTYDALSILRPFAFTVWALITAITILCAALRLLEAKNGVLRSSTALITIMSLVATVHLHNLYRASLVSVYLLRAPRSPVTTFGQVVDRIEEGEAKLVLHKNTTLSARMIYTNMDEDVRRLRRALLTNPPMFEVDDESRAMHLVRMGGAFYFDLDGSNFYHRMEKDCNLKTIPVPLPSKFKLYQTIVVNKENVKLIDRLNNAMDSMVVQLLNAKLEEKYHRLIEWKQGKCAKLMEEAKGSRRPITVKNVSGAFWGLIAVHIAAFIVLLCELGHRLLRMKT